MSVGFHLLIGWMTLNSDGAAKGSPGLAGGGGAIRDHSANFGICTAYKAEIKAVAIGLDLAHDLGVTKLIVQMDNAACIQSLLSDEYSGGDWGVFPYSCSLSKIA